MNGDLLTKFNLGQLIDYHNKNNSFLSICTREYQTKIPFGVVDHEGIEFKNFRETIL